MSYRVKLATLTIKKPLHFGTPRQGLPADRRTARCHVAEHQFSGCCPGARSCDDRPAVETVCAPPRDAGPVAVAHRLMPVRFPSQFRPSYRAPTHLRFLTGSAEYLLQPGSHKLVRVLVNVGICRRGQEFAANQSSAAPRNLRRYFVTSLVRSFTNSPIRSSSLSSSRNGRPSDTSQLRTSQCAETGDLHR